MEEPREFRLSPAFFAYVLAAALIIASASVVVSQTERDSTVNGQRVVQLGYGLPFAFTAATTNNTTPFNLFSNLKQATNPANFQPLAYLGDILLWAALIGFLVWQSRLPITPYSFLGMVIVGFIFVALMNLVFSFTTLKSPHHADEGNRRAYLINSALGMLSWRRIAFIVPLSHRIQFNTFSNVIIDLLVDIDGELMLR